jgi:hypothetical protein
MSLTLTNLLSCSSNFISCISVDALRNSAPPLILFWYESVR